MREVNVGVGRDGSHIGAVTICSSSRFYSTVQRLAADLKPLGITVHTPNLDYDERFTRVGTVDKKRLTLDFLEKVRDANLVYVVDEGGYTGTSVSIEVGFAAALGKIIVLSEEPAEAAIAALAHRIIPVDRFPDDLRAQVF